MRVSRLLAAPDSVLTEDLADILVPTLGVGMPPWKLRVSAAGTQSVRRRVPTRERGNQEASGLARKVKVSAIVASALWIVIPALAQDSPEPPKPPASLF